MELNGLPHWESGLELGQMVSTGREGFHWDKADVGTVAATLHFVHNISGLRAGTLPGVSQQNGFLGLPVTLMQEETAYLVMQGIAHLLPVSTEPAFPSPEHVARRTEERLARLRAIEARNRASEEAKAARGAKAFMRGGEQAKAKREERARMKAAKAASAGGGNAGEAQSDGKEGVKSHRAPATITGAHFHTVPSHPLFPTVVHSSPPITRLPHPLFPFPSCPRDRALLATFTDLQQQGYRMGLGPRFGGEYLIYPGDYLRYHAHFTSQVLVRDEPIKPTEIVAWGRLGTGTKKAGLICCWDDDHDDDAAEFEPSGEKDGQVEYYSLEWASFG
ncbi:hypothetical protein JCM24511_00449 [Saitozyma sp. JCM 24511]|nr:hypothetical protein JCM24511_00449 [Saitozyma sp. JCM 24511]